MKYFCVLQPPLQQQTIIATYPDEYLYTPLWRFSPFFRITTHNLTMLIFLWGGKKDGTVFF